MVSQQQAPAGFMVSIHEDVEHGGVLRFTFVPMGNRPQQANGGPSSYIASVTGHGDEAKVTWLVAPEHKRTRAELEKIARHRSMIRREWLARLQSLMETVRGWADGLDWATRIVEVPIEDAEIGEYRALGLLLQKESVRLFLEPVARVAPGTEGIVDLYLMPSYDDIASLYYDGNRWNVHYVFERGTQVAKIHEPKGKPLTKTMLQQVLDEMKAHAA